MSSVSKLERDKQKLIQEKCQNILAHMLRDEDNKYCVDCDAKGPRWASWNLGIFLCIRCAGIHRNLGVHISRVKSVNLDSWTPEQVTSLQQMGNSRARAVYEAYLPENFRRPQTDSALETFVRAKYEHKKYIAKEWVCPPPLKVSWDAEIELELKQKKEAKRKTNGSPGVVELPAPTAARSRAAETTPSASPLNSSKESQPRILAPVELVAVVKAHSAAQDLLGLETAMSSSSASNDLFGVLLSGPTPQVQPNESPAVSKNSEEDNFFNQKAPTTAEKKTMDKDSILALYNQGTQAPMHNMFSSTGVPPTGNIYGNPQTGFGQAPTSSMAPGLIGVSYNPMIQGSMFPSPVFPSNGSTTGQSIPPMSQLSQQLSGMTMGTGPALHPTNPPLNTVGSSQFIPGLMSVPPMGNPPPAQVNSNPYMFLSSGQTLSTNLWH